MVRQSSDLMNFRVVRLKIPYPDLVSWKAGSDVQASGLYHGVANLMKMAEMAGFYGAYVRSRE
jgi:hypothetical protein